MRLCVGSTACRSRLERSCRIGHVRAEGLGGVSQSVNRQFASIERTCHDGLNTSLDHPHDRYYTLRVIISAAAPTQPYKNTAITINLENDQRIPQVGLFSRLMYLPLLSDFQRTTTSGRYQRNPICRKCVINGLQRRGGVKELPYVMEGCDLIL